MFCDKCGTTLHAGAEYCSNCGKPVVPSPGPVRAQSVGTQAVGVDRVRRNLSLMAILWLVYGILRVISGLWLVVFERAFLPWFLGNFGAHTWPIGNGWGWERWVPLGIYTVGIYTLAFAVAYLLLAWGLHERKSWARILGIVLGFLVLLRFPFGTALGIYTLWVLLPAQSGREFDAMARA